MFQAKLNRSPSRNARMHPSRRRKAMLTSAKFSLGMFSYLVLCTVPRHVMLVAENAACNVYRRQVTHISICRFYSARQAATSKSGEVQMLPLYLECPMPPFPPLIPVVTIDVSWTFRPFHPRT